MSRQYYHEMPDGMYEECNAKSDATCKNKNRTLNPPVNKIRKKKPVEMGVGGVGGSAPAGALNAPVFLSQRGGVEERLKTDLGSFGIPTTFVNRHSGNPQSLRKISEAYSVAQNYKNTTVDLDSSVKEKIIEDYINDPNSDIVKFEENLINAGLRATAVEEMGIEDPQYKNALAQNSVMFARVEEKNKILEDARGMLSEKDYEDLRRDVLATGGGSDTPAFEAKVRQKARSEEIKRIQAERARKEQERKDAESRFKEAEAKKKERKRKRAEFWKKFWWGA